MELLRKHLKAFGEKGHLRGMDGNLACLGGKHSSPDAGHISDVHLLKILISLFPHAVTGNIDLDTAF